MGDSIDTAGRLAQALVKTGLTPQGMTPGQAFYILLAGKEIGVRGPVEALRHIQVVKGKPTMSAELMRAFMLEAGCKIEWERQDDTGAILKVTRPDGSTGTFSFLEADARRAGLLGTSGSGWSKYPAAMYAARATSVAARLFCPDMVRGATYTPEELGAVTTVTDDGMVEALPPRIAPPPASSSPAPHVDAAATPEVPEAEGSTAGAGDEDALPFDEPEGGPLPAPVSGPDPSTEAVPDRLTTQEVDAMILFLAGKLGISTAGGPVATLVAVEEKLRDKRAPYSSEQIDTLTHDQGKALMTWAKKNGGAK